MAVLKGQTFNPQILDASMRDVVSALSSEQKTEVLLYAMERISSAQNPRSRTTIENATQSVLQVSATRPDKIIQARLLRAKARFAAGMRGAAHQDLQMILQIDPNHREAASLIPSGVKHLSGEFGGRMRAQPRFSNEIWREVATYLCKRDLRSLLPVPHALSSIASQFLLRRVHLHFGTGAGSSSDTLQADEWHSRRSAEILSQLISDSTYASYVHSLILFAPDADDALSAFQITMITNVLPRLINLDTFGCKMGGRSMQAILVALERSHPTLKSLILDPTSPLPHDLPTFPLLTRFAYGANALESTPPDISNVLCGRSVALRSLVLHNRRIPIDRRIPMNNVTSLDFKTTFRNTDVLDMIFSEGLHLQTLRIKCVIGDNCRLSSVFRVSAISLPALRCFQFDVVDVHQGVNDPDLFSSITEFVRRHPLLRFLRVSTGPNVQTLGYNAVVWSVLPTLSNLEGLSMNIPQDLTPVLSSWLIPRSVITLHLCFPTAMDAEFLRQLWSGLPKSLKILSVPALELSPALRELLASNLPELKLLCLGGVNYSISHTEHGVETEEWSDRRSLYHIAEELESIGGDWEFTPWAARLPWNW
ncbi:hypothetical protein OF83DRAFT_1157906 [Amylostereum chailletii]|nr:hypothetical protein OF83DRAFT_1157906 [Amylostereum chailletii]